MMLLGIIHTPTECREGTNVVNGIFGLGGVRSGVGDWKGKSNKDSLCIRKFFLSFY